MTTFKLPDARYSATLEHCGHPEPRWIARFCDEWLRDREGNQYPTFKHECGAIAACIQYEKDRSL